MIYDKTIKGWAMGRSMAAAAASAAAVTVTVTVLIASSKQASPCRLQNAKYSVNHTKYRIQNTKYNNVK